MWSRLPLSLRDGAILAAAGLVGCIAGWVHNVA